MDKNQRKLRQYQEAIEASSIVSKTDTHGIITFVNDEFCRISGYSKDELIGSNHNIIRHPDVSSEVFAKLWKTILDKKVYRGIIKNKAKDGSSFYLNATIIPILDDNGDIEEFIAIRHNVTEVVLLNENLLKTRTELKELNLLLEQKVKEQTKELLDLNQSLKDRIEVEVRKNEEKNKIMFSQARLAAMGEMIANIAHQWRQPLNELSLVLYKLKTNKQNEEEFQKTYNHAKNVIKNMSSTIDDFSNFFNTNKKEDIFCVNDIIKNSIIMLKATLQHENINIKLDLKATSKIYAVKSELTQVVLNIIGNAKDALKKEENITKTITITTFNHRKFVYIDINDNAKPIPKEILEKIFDPYFTTKHPNAGTGLGLYMSKMIIEKINGEILVKNFKNSVSFIIKLPIKEGYCDK